MSWVSDILRRARRAAEEEARRAAEEKLAAAVMSEETRRLAERLYAQARWVRDDLLVNRVEAAKQGVNQLCASLEEVIYGSARNR